MEQSPVGEPARPRTNSIHPSPASPCRRSASSRRSAEAGITLVGSGTTARSRAGATTFPGRQRHRSSSIPPSPKRSLGAAATPVRSRETVPSPAGDSTTTARRPRCRRPAPTHRSAQATITTVRSGAPAPSNAGARARRTPAPSMIAASP